jgi:hypothetical protein
VATLEHRPPQKEAALLNLLSNSSATPHDGSTSSAHDVQRQVTLFLALVSGMGEVPMPDMGTCERAIHAAQAGYPGSELYCGGEPINPDWPIREDTCVVCIRQGLNQRPW